MRLDMDVSLDLSGLERLVRQAPAAADRGIRKLAIATQRRAQDRAPVDTGALKSSIYAVTSKGSGMAKALAEARARRPGVRQAENAPAEVRPMEAWVACGVEYGIFVEYGAMFARKPGFAEFREAVAPGETPHYNPGRYALRPGYLMMTDAAEWARRNGRAYIEAEIAREAEG